MSSSNRFWVRFEGKKSDGTVVKLRIQDLPKERFEDGIDLFMKYFYAGEAMTKAAGIANNPESMKESREMSTTMHNDPDSHCVICCEDTEGDDFGDIIGISMMTVVRPGADTISDVKTITQEWKTLGLMFEEICQRYDPIKELNLSSVYDDRGIVVHPEYRGLGIGREFIKLRRIICKEHKVPATAAWYTSAVTQKIAENDNWETVSEVKYAELEENFGVKFTDVPETCKLMIARI